MFGSERLNRQRERDGEKVWVKGKKKREEGLMSSTRSDNGLSNLLTPLNSMRHPVCLVFSGLLFPCLSVYLSVSWTSLRVTSLLASSDFGFKDGSRRHHLWRKDNVWWSELQWLSNVNCNLSPTTDCNCSVWDTFRLAPQGPETVASRITGLEQGLNFDLWLC